MNTCARIENTGLPGRVHLSQEVADLLFRDGKAAWFEPRKDTVTAKGKGELHTYWLVTTAPGRSVRGGLRDNCSAHNTEDSMTDLEDIDCLRLNSAQDKTSRLIEWNVEKLVKILKQIVAHRESISLNRGSNHRKSSGLDVSAFNTCKGTPFEAVKEIISLPAYNSHIANNQKNPEDVIISEEVVDQLRDYVTRIASMYQNNPFHNFEHASHVVQSVCKVCVNVTQARNTMMDSFDFA